MLKDRNSKGHFIKGNQIARKHETKISDRELIKKNREKIRDILSLEVFSLENIEEDLSTIEPLERLRLFVALKKLVVPAYRVQRIEVEASDIKNSVLQLVDTNEKLEAFKKKYGLNSNEEEDASTYNNETNNETKE